MSAITTTCINAEKIGESQTKESKERIKLIEKLIEFNDENNGIPEESKIIKYIRIHQPQKILIILEQNEFIKSQIKLILQRIELLDSYLSTINKQPQYSLIIYHEFKEPIMICEDFKYREFIVLFEKCIEDNPNKSIFNYFKTKQEFTITNFPKGSEIIIHFSIDYIITKQMENSIRNKLDGSYYFLYSLQYPNRKYIEPIVVLNYSPINLFLNGLIPSFLTQNAFTNQHQIEEINGVIITPLAQEYNIMKIFASRITRFIVRPMKIKMNEIIDNNGKRIVWKGEFINNEYGVEKKEIVIKQYKESEYYLNESYLDYLEQSCLLTGATNEFNRIVDKRNEINKIQNNERRFKHIQFYGSQLFVTTNEIQTNENVEMGLEQIKEFINGKEKLIIEMFLEINEEKVAINHKGSAIGKENDEKDYDIFGGLLSVEAFNHFLYSPTINEKSNKILMKNVRVFLNKSNEYQIIKAELIHNRPSKYFFNCFCDEFEELKKNFFTNHHCQTLCQEFIQKDDETKKIKFEVEDYNQTNILLTANPN